VNGDDVTNAGRNIGGIKYNSAVTMVLLTPEKFTIVTVFSSDPLHKKRAEMRASKRIRVPYSEIVASVSNLTPP